MTMDQSQVNHMGFEGNLNTINIITKIKVEHVIFTRVTLLRLTKIAQEKVLFHIFSIQVKEKKSKK